MSQHPPGHRYIRLRLLDGVPVDQVASECANFLKLPGLGNGHQAVLSTLSAITAEMPSAAALSPSAKYLELVKDLQGVRPRSHRGNKPKDDDPKTVYLKRFQLDTFLTKEGRQLLEKALSYWMTVRVREFLQACALSGASPEHASEVCPDVLAGAQLTPASVKAFWSLFWDLNDLTPDAKLSVLRASGSYQSLETSLTAGLDAWMFSAGLTEFVSTSLYDQTRVIQNIAFVRLARNRGPLRAGSRASDFSKDYMVWAHATEKLRELDNEAAARLRSQDSASFDDRVTFDGDALGAVALSGGADSSAGSEFRLPVLRAPKPSVSYDDLLRLNDVKEAKDRITGLERDRVIGSNRADALRAQLDQGQVEEVFRVLNLLAKSASSG